MVSKISWGGVMAAGTVPMEVIRDAGDFRVGTLTACAPDESFAYPPRPADALGGGAGC